MIDFPDGTAWRLHERWRGKLDEAQLLYLEQRNEATREEYRRVLKIFADLVIRNTLPKE